MNLQWKRFLTNPETWILIILSFAVIGVAAGCTDRPEIMKSPNDFYAEGQKSVRDSIKLNWKGDVYRKTIDSLNSKLHENDGQRYFLVAYQSMLKTDHFPITGNTWFVSNGFPTKHEIDSLVYTGFSKSKECYQPVLILNIYEFKTFGDYWAYSNDYKGQANIKKKKKCCVICPGELFVFPVPDSSIIYK